jgi:hypothetical protein
MVSAKRKALVFARNLTEIVLTGGIVGGINLITESVGYKLTPLDAALITLPANLAADVISNYIIPVTNAAVEKELQEENLDDAVNNADTNPSEGYVTTVETSPGEGYMRTKRSAGGCGLEIFEALLMSVGVYVALSKGDAAALDPLRVEQAQAANLDVLATQSQYLWQFFKVPTLAALTVEGGEMFIRGIGKYGKKFFGGVEKAGKTVEDLKYKGSSS